MRKIISVILLFFLLFISSGCSCKKKQYSDHSFVIIIKSNYKEKYQNGLFNLDDFNYDNVLTFSYTQWDEKNNAGTIFIFLKKTGNEEVEKAINQFEKLDFVEKCYKIETEYLTKYDQNNNS